MHEAGDRFPKTTKKKLFQERQDKDFQNSELSIKVERDFRDSKTVLIIMPLIMFIRNGGIC